MKKFLVAGVLGVAMMAAACTSTATAAVWRSGYRGYVNTHPVYHTEYRPTYHTAYRHFDYVRRPYVENHYGYYAGCRDNCGYFGGCW